MGAIGTVFARRRLLQPLGDIITSPTQWQRWRRQSGHQPCHWIISLINFISRLCLFGVPARNVCLTFKHSRLAKGQSNTCCKDLGLRGRRLGIGSYFFLAPRHTSECLEVAAKLLCCQSVPVLLGFPLSSHRHCRLANLTFCQSILKKHKETK